MDICDIEVAPAGSGLLDVSATAAGIPLRIRLPEGRFHAPALGDALVVSALVPAMREGVALRLPVAVPVSGRLADAVSTIQRIYRSWNFSLGEVALEAEIAQSGATGRGTGLFYAGGVDSSYSLIAHEAEVDTLVTVLGFDMAMDDEEMAANRARNTEFARRLRKDIVFVESNHRAFLRELGVSRTFAYGAILASVALLLGLHRCYVASSHSVGHLRPEGSHPVLDGLFSNDTTEIVHDDVTVSRLGKTRAIAGRPDVLDNLRVCWDYPNHNCGRCLKCVRTMAALAMCRASGPFPPELTMAAVKHMASHTELDYVVEMAVEAHRLGDERMFRALRGGLRRRDVMEGIRHLAYGLTGRKLRRPGRSALERNLVKHDLRPDLDLR